MRAQYPVHYAYSTVRMVPYALCVQYHVCARLYNKKISLSINKLNCLIKHTRVLYNNYYYNNNSQSGLLKRN